MRADCAAADDAAMRCEYASRQNHTVVTAFVLGKNSIH